MSYKTDIIWTGMVHQHNGFCYFLFLRRDRGGQRLAVDGIVVAELKLKFMTTFCWTLPPSLFPITNGKNQPFYMIFHPRKSKYTYLLVCGFGVVLNWKLSTELWRTLNRLSDDERISCGCFKRLANVKIKINFCSFSKRVGVETFHRKYIILRKWIDFYRESLLITVS